MKWENYSKEFESTALRNNFTLEEISLLLGYAKNLYDKKLPVIYDQEHLALLVGYKYEYLLKISNASRKFYRTFTIPKKSGGERKISEPLPSLKEIQHWILQEILDQLPVSRLAKAYVKKRSIRENARFHIGQKVVLTIDLENFFSSLKYKKVFLLFLHLGYSVPVSTMLSNLCCLDGSLPQGAPTSPTLSNLLMVSVDKRIFGFTKEKEIRYTRYADDMTFSGDFEPGMVIKFVGKVLSQFELKINEKKTRVRRPGQKQEVTGVIVNEKIQAPKELRKQLRQAVYYIEKYGLASHLEKTENLKANHVYHWLGIANFILFLNPNDEEALRYKKILHRYVIRDEQ